MRKDWILRLNKFKKKAHHSKRPFRPMKYIFVDESWDDYLYWQKTNKKMLKRINDLLKDISRNPFSGIGKPEPLKYKYKGFWSRRIDNEHRLIYQVKNNEILIAKCRFHYD